MPIETEIQFRRLSEEQFKALDYSVMGASFEIQNQYGRLFGEGIYRDRVCELLEGSLKCAKESSILLAHKGFRKQLRMDLVVDDGLICELKVVDCFSPAHESQLLEYMVLCGATRGKLINFGSASVEGKLISSSFTHDERHVIEVVDNAFMPIDSKCSSFRSQMIDLVFDWGAFLKTSTWIEAMTFLLGGDSVVIR